jgi:uncharacterized protein
MNISETEMGKSLGLLYPDNRVIECAVRNENFFVIEPEGKLSKCWENVGDKNECYGFLDSKGNLNITNITIYNRYLYGEDPLADPVCQKCKFLPICIGGCPYYRIRKAYENTKINICTEFKESLFDYLEKRVLQYIQTKK